MTFGDTPLLQVALTMAESSFAIFDNPSLPELLEKASFASLSFNGFGFVASGSDVVCPPQAKAQGGLMKEI
jgi:hypothetical protein